MGTNILMNTNTDDAWGSHRHGRAERPPPTTDGGFVAICIFVSSFVYIKNRGNISATVVLFTSYELGSWHFFNKPSSPVHFQSTARCILATQSLSLRDALKRFCASNHSLTGLISG